MSQISKSTFDTTYVNASGTFATNTTRDVSEADLRQFADDIVDSAMFINDNFIDEDSFASDSATKAPSQQSVKAYIESQIVGANGILPDSGSEPALKYKVLQIGDWDMDTDDSTNVAHGLSDFKKVREISFVVRDDTDTVYYTSNSGSLAVGQIDSTNVGLARTGGTVFDSTDFDSTSYNRGWVTIIFES